ncbi:MAG: hypothetical protein GY696_26095, partial [Gammaproteobacteria bacterium]|nr:hypothetical protein [Gammaproteobacteria bacterium]
MSTLELRAVQLVIAVRINLIHGTAAHSMWKGLELENSPWTPHPINRSQRIQQRQGNASVQGKQEQPATANQLACGKRRTRVGTGPATHPHQHHRVDAPSPPELAQTYVGFRPLPGAVVQPRAAREQEEELPEDLEPEEPPRAEGPPQEEKTQLPQPQISTLGCPTGLVFTHKVKTTIPVSICPCNNEHRLSPFQEGNSPPHSAQESGLGSLEELSLGAELVGPAGLGLS